MIGPNTYPNFSSGATTLRLLRCCCEDGCQPRECWLCCSCWGWNSKLWLACYLKYTEFMQIKKRTINLNYENKSDLIMLCNITTFIKVHVVENQSILQYWACKEEQTYTLNISQGMLLFNFLMENSPASSGNTSC